MRVLKLSILDRYIAGHVIGATMLAMVVLVVLFSVLEYAYQLSKLDASYSSTASTTLLKLPRLCYELFPAVIAIGTMIGLGGLATGSQLIVIRTAGVSPARITLSALLGAVVLIPLVVVVGEVLTPYSETRLQERRHIAAGGGNPIWLRSDTKVIRLGKVISQDWIEEVRIYDFTDGELSSITHVAKMRRDADRWLLSDLRRSSFTPTGVHAEQLDTQALALDIDPGLVRVTVKYPRTLSLSQLWAHIAYLQQNGMATNHSAVVFWAKVFYPLSLVGMVLAAAPLILGWVNTTLLGARIMIGVFGGVGFYILSRIVEQRTIAWGLPPVVGAATPLLLLLGVAYLLQRRLH